MSDWEDLCEHYDVSNTGDSDWLVGMIDKGNAKYPDHEENLYEEIIFKNLQETREYAMKNKGSVFTRHPNGLGFTLKSKRL